MNYNQRPPCLTKYIPQTVIHFRFYFQFLNLHIFENIAQGRQALNYLTDLKIFLTFHFLHAEYSNRTALRIEIRNFSIVHWFQHTAQIREPIVVRYQFAVGAHVLLRVLTVGSKVEVEDQAVEALIACRYILGALQVLKCKVRFNLSENERCEWWRQIRHLPSLWIKWKILRIIIMKVTDTSILTLSTIRYFNCFKLYYELTDRHYPVFQMY